MKHPLPRRGVRTALFCALACAFMETTAVAASATVGVRVPTEHLPALQRLALAPHYSSDYAGFRWLELSAEQFDLLRAAGVPAQLEADANRIRFGRFDFDPLRGQAEAGAYHPLTAKGSGLRLVQFHGPVKPQWLDALREQGLRPLQYYPGNAYLVWASAPGAGEAAAALPFVRWQGAFVSAYKPDEDLAGRQGPIRNVDVHFYNDGDVDGVLAALADTGAKLLRHAPAQRDGAFFDAWIEADAATLERIAAIPQVVWLGYASPRPVLEDEMSAQILAGNYNAANVPQTGYVPWLASIDYSGNGVTWAVIDTGIDLGHPDLAPVIAGGFSYPGCSTTGGDDFASGGHGTHVAGIIAGQANGDGTNAAADGNGFRYGQGVAPGVRLYSFSTVDCGAPWPPTGGWQELSKRGLAAGTVGANASWTTGEGTAHGYKASERTFDTMIRDGDFDSPTPEPYIFVFSAGNSGPGATTLTAPKEAKNPITVAASRNFRAGAIDTIASFSSRGPAVDGRLLPTIAAPGDTIASTRRRAGASSCGTAISGTGGLYSNCSGTSMAAPHISGSSALLVDWWRGQHGGATPSPAMVKALLVNGAVPSDTAPLPNNTQGWGRVKLPNSLGLDASTFHVDQADLLDATGQVREYTVGVPDPSKPLRVSLVWTDAPGAIGASPALVNNLDLEVVNGDSTYLGNVFANGVSVTGGSADAKNNVENVYIAAPAGSATIRVRATALVGDGVPGNGTPLDQDFALVCSNCAQEPTYTIAVAPAAAAVCAPAEASFAISTGAVLGYGMPITFAASGTPAGGSATFMPNPVVPGALSTLTIGNTAAVVPGHYALTLEASSASGPQSRALALDVANAVAAAPIANTPGDGAGNQLERPVFSWEASAQAVDYTIEIARDADFGQIVQSATVAALTWTPPSALDTGTRYYWSVRANNACGSGTFGAPRAFTTAAAPGDCPLDTKPVSHFFDDVENGDNSWTHSAARGTDTWAISEARSTSPTHAWKGINLATVSDQALDSPAITLPDASQVPITLQFQHWRAFEGSATSCWDGGVLEVALDGGAFAAVPEVQLLTNAYTGTISSSFQNPLGGRRAWCGSQPFVKTIVDLAPYAGRAAKFRFRLGTDSSNAAEGWYIDDVSVRGCVAVPIEDDTLFKDGFELAN